MLCPTPRLAGALICPTETPVRGELSQFLQQAQRHAAFVGRIVNQTQMRQPTNGEGGSTCDSGRSQRRARSSAKTGVRDAKQRERPERNAEALTQKRIGTRHQERNARLNRRCRRVPGSTSPAHGSRGSVSEGLTCQEVSIAASTGKQSGRWAHFEPRTPRHAAPSPEYPRARPQMCGYNSWAALRMRAGCRCQQRCERHSNRTAFESLPPGSNHILGLEPGNRNWQGDPIGPNTRSQAESSGQRSVRD